MANNALIYNRNSMNREDYGSLPIKDQYGQYQVGGDLGMNDIRGQFASDPQAAMAAGLVEDVIPIAGDLRSVNYHIPNQYEAYQNASTPIQKVLRAAELGLEGGTTAASLIPGVKIAAATLGPLIAMMARKSDDVIWLARGPLRTMAGTIGSTGAKTADLAALTRAQELKASGASADDIYGQTRWWLDHPDGRPRFEIDDSGSNLSETFRQDIKDYGVRRQENILPHDELYSQYPDTKDIGVMQTNYRDSMDSGGSYVPEDDMITLNLRDTANTDDVKSINLHEIQHAVQGREGMARGGSPSDFTNWDIDALRASNLESADAFKKMMRAEMDSGMSMNDAYKKVTSTEQGQIAVSNMEKLQGAIKEYENPVENYRRLAGESEARLVQDRMNMTMPERLAPGNEFYKKFDVPLEDQIVRMEGGLAQSADNLPIMREIRPSDVATGKPVKFHSVHNTDTAPNAGARFGQDKEPAGRFMSSVSENHKLDSPQFEYGMQEFKNPLVVEFGEGYGTAGNWKSKLSDQYNGLTGVELTRAMQADGYDGIITVSKSANDTYVSEIVDLGVVPRMEGRVAQSADLPKKK